MQDHSDARETVQVTPLEMRWNEMQYHWDPADSSQQIQCYGRFVAPELHGQQHETISQDYQHNVWTCRVKQRDCCGSATQLGCHLYMCQNMHWRWCASSWTRGSPKDLSFVSLILSMIFATEHEQNRWWHLQIGHHIAFKISLGAVDIWIIAYCNGILGFWWQTLTKRPFGVKFYKVGGCCVSADVNTSKRHWFTYLYNQLIPCITFFDRCFNLALLCSACFRGLVLNPLTKRYLQG